MTRPFTSASACPLLLSVLALGSAPAGAAAAERAAPSDEHRKTAAIVTSAVTPFFGAYYLQGEVRASSSFGVLLNTSYLALESDDWKVRAGTVGAGVDYYFGGNALRGWYAEAIGEVWFNSWRHGPSKQVAPVEIGYAAVAIAGYQFVCDLGPVLDLGVGATAFYVPRAHVSVAGTPTSSKAITRVYPAAKVDVGWAF